MLHHKENIEMKKSILAFVAGVIFASALAWAQIAVETKTTRTARFQETFSLVSGDNISVSSNRFSTKTLTVPSGRTANVTVTVHAELE